MSDLYDDFTGGVWGFLLVNAVNAFNVRRTSSAGNFAGTFREPLSVQYYFIICQVMII